MLNCMQHRARFTQQLCPGIQRYSERSYDLEFAGKIEFEYWKGRARHVKVVLLLSLHDAMSERL
jgi:hypothetical protein